MSIELPKDAKGRKISLDTNVLYDQDGNSREVARFAYTPSRDYDKWDVIFVNGYDRYASEMLLDPPEPPDTWEKLLEDLESCCVSTRYTPCAYFNKSNDACEKCLADPSKECLAQMVKHITLRIHKLRGEG